MEDCGRQVRNFCRNSERDTSQKVGEVLRMLNDAPDQVSRCIEIFRKIKHGARIPVTSAFLRFLDPIEHRYGIIDKNVAAFLNSEGITNFSLRSNGYVFDTRGNVEEYQSYHNWLHQKVEELHEENAMYTDIYGNALSFAPVDVDMAIFAYTTRQR